MSKVPPVLIPVDPVHGAHSRPRRVLIPEHHYQGKEPEYIRNGAPVDHHVDGESWGGFSKGSRPEGWFTSAFDQYYVSSDDIDWSHPEAPQK